MPKAPGFRFPGPQNDSGLAPRPLPLSHLSFLVLLLPLIEEKIDSFHIKHLLRMPSSLRGSHVRSGTLEGKCCFFRLPVCLPFTWQRLSAMPLWDAALWGQSAQSPGVSIPRTPKRLGARPETPPVMLRYVSVAFLLPLIKVKSALFRTKYLLKCLLLEEKVGQRPG